MTWAQPQWLYALVAVVGMALLLGWTHRRHHARLARYFPHGFDSRILPLRIRRRRAFATFLFIAGMFAAVIALAEPRFGKRLIEVNASGVDLILAVDLSRSMDAKDILPSRLERAKREIGDLVNHLDGDRVGMVAFAGGAYPRMPLTLDYGALRLVTRSLNTDMFQAQGSNVAPALEASLQLLSMAEDGAGKGIILMTDGEIRDLTEAKKVAQTASKLGVVIYGLVIGEETAPVPYDGGAWVQDPSTGKRAMTTPNAKALQALAEITGGAVLHSVPGDEDIRVLYNTEISQKLTAVSGRKNARAAFDSAVGWPLGIAMFCTLLAVWLGDGRRIQQILLVLLALGGLLAPQHAKAQDDALHAAQDAYAHGDAATAAEILRKLAIAHPDDPSLWMRLGAARYRAHDAIGAARAFDRAHALGAGSNASYNAGNAWWKAGVLSAAEQRYKDALKATPNHKDAAQNLKMLQQVRQQQAQQQQSGDQGEEKPQDGKPQDGKPQDGKPQSPQQSQQSGESKPPDGTGSPSQGGENPQSPDASQDPESANDQQTAPAGELGEKPEDLSKITSQGGEAGQADAGAEQANANANPQAEAAGEKKSAAEMSADAASRILDGVEEGSPRIYIPGQGEGKPW